MLVVSASFVLMWNIQHLVVHIVRHILQLNNVLLHLDIQCCDLDNTLIWLQYGNMHACSSRAVHEYHHHHNMAAQYGGLLLPPATRLPPHVTASHQYSKGGVPEPWGAASHSAAARLHHGQATAPPSHAHALDPAGYSAYPTMAGKWRHNDKLQHWSEKWRRTTSVINKLTHSDEDGCIMGCCTI